VKWPWRKKATPVEEMKLDDLVWLPDRLSFEFDGKMESTVRLEPDRWYKCFKEGHLSACYPDVQFERKEPFFVLRLWYWRDGKVFPPSQEVTQGLYPRDEMGAFHPNGSTLTLRDISVHYD
jgi:hypothetical protein